MLALDGRHVMGCNLQRTLRQSAQPDRATGHAYYVVSGGGKRGCCVFREGANWDTHGTRRWQRDPSHSGRGEDQRRSVKREEQQRRIRGEADRFSETYPRRVGLFLSMKTHYCHMIDLYTRVIETLARLW